jgi:membrane-associated protein
MLDLGSVDPGSPVGYMVAFTVPMLDAFLAVVPSESVVIGLGVLAAQSFDFRLIPLVLLVTAGAFCGDNMAGPAVRRAHRGPSDVVTTKW